MDIFNMDSPLMQKLGLLFDLMILNVLTVLLSLPVITMGAAATALYDAVWRLKHNCGSLIRDYWRSFCSNFKQATGLWLFLLFFGILLGYNVLLLIGGQAGIALMIIPMLLGAVVWVIISAWIFPLQSRFEDTIGRTIINALLCGLRFLPRTVAMSVLNLGPWVLLVLAPEIFFRWGLIWAFLWFGVAAYSNICLLDGPLSLLAGSDPDKTGEVALE